MQRKSSIFLCIVEREYLRRTPKVQISEDNAKEKTVFLCGINRAELIFTKSENRKNPSPFTFVVLYLSDIQILAKNA